MNDSFDIKDVVTALTREQVKVGDKGYFGDNLRDLEAKVKYGDVHSLVKIYNDYFTLYPFKSDCHVNCFALFLPSDKVKNKEPVYRPLKNIDELFNFLTPDIDVDCDILEKVKLILSRIYELRGKQTGYIYYRTFTRICLTDKGIRLDESTLNYIFENYEIKRDGGWVPFGVEE